MVCAFMKCFLQWNAFEPSLFQIFKAYYPVTHKNLHFLVRFRAVLANELSALPIKDDGLRCGTPLANRLQFPLCFCHFVVYLFHSLHEERGLKAGNTVRSETRPCDIQGTETAYP